ncbi:SMI1/KNR4 family protein [Streptomyces sp. XY431]|uniref:SMI1/KNR4 family protein n=1 Tax=Streptomyces sp. XY431 TaxID=1415562 RepID=UPI0006AEFA03|nr:SMI1/KNR4 family protein [Streptomyces sp. XY431]
MSDDQSAAIAAMASLGEVLSCVGPTCGDIVDWIAAEKVHGTPFPADYRAFVAAFGNGSIEEMVGVDIPATSDELRFGTLSRLSEAALADFAVNRWAPADRGRHRLEDLLIWGETGAADTLCWITTDPDPDRWPVAVYSRMNLEWSVYPCGMAEFLLKMLRDEWPQCPISDSSLQGMPDPRFLHNKDAAASWELGNNPWE